MVEVGLCGEKDGDFPPATQRACIDGGLLCNWPRLPLTSAAHTVMISAFPGCFDIAPDVEGVTGVACRTLAVQEGARVALHRSLPRLLREALEVPTAAHIERLLDRGYGDAARFLADATARGTTPWDIR